MSKEDSTRTPTEIADPKAVVSRDNPNPVIDNLQEKVYDNPRSEIYARHKDKRDHEIDDGEGGFTDPEPKNPVNQDENTDLAVEKPKPADIIEGDQPKQVATPKDVTPDVEVVVYGETHRVPKSKIDSMPGKSDTEKLQAYQKHLAVEKGLENNAHRAKSLDQREQAIEDKERRLADAELVVPATDRQTEQDSDRSTPKGDQNLTEMARQYQEAVYDGDENAPSMLADMVAQAANTGEKFDEDALRKRVKGELQEDQRQESIATARDIFIDAHPELNERDSSFDPRLFENVNTETDVVAREPGHESWSPKQVMDEAYNRVQKWRGTNEANPDTESMEAKAALKREQNNPRASSARYTPPAAPPPESRSSYVQRTREARGLE